MCLKCSRLTWSIIQKPLKVPEQFNVAMFRFQSTTSLCLCHINNQNVTVVASDPTAVRCDQSVSFISKVQVRRRDSHDIGIPTYDDLLIPTTAASLLIYLIWASNYIQSSTNVIFREDSDTQGSLLWIRHWTADMCFS